MLSLEEIIHCGTAPADINPDKLAQTQDLLDRVNKVRLAWNKPMTVTSGMRTWADHLRIYAAKGITDLNKIPKASHHLETVTDSAAVDIADPGLEITAWLKGGGAQVLEDAGLYCEQGNSNWVHFQNCAPRSGNRWFLP
jgi:hypothetical protein